MAAVIDDHREAAHARRQAARQRVDARDLVAAVGPGLGHHLALGERSLEADAAFERPRRRDQRARDWAVRVGVDDHAVVRTQQIGGAHGVGTHRERRLLDHRPAGGDAESKREQTDRGARATATPPIGSIDDGGRIDRSVGSCY